MRVPLVLAGAGVPAGARVPAPVQTLDLPRTFCEAAGAEAPADEMDGWSLTPYLQGPDSGPHDRFLLFGTSTMSLGARSGRYKALGLGDDVVLFDLEDDPFESVDLADSDEGRQVLEPFADGVRSVLQRPAFEVSAADLLTSGG